MPPFYHERVQGWRGATMEGNGGSTCADGQTYLGRYFQQSNGLCRTAGAPTAPVTLAPGLHPSMNTGTEARLRFIRLQATCTNEIGHHYSFPQWFEQVGHQARCAALVWNEVWKRVASRGGGATRSRSRGCKRGRRFAICDALSKGATGRKHGLPARVWRLFQGMEH